MAAKSSQQDSGAAKSKLESELAKAKAKATNLKGQAAKVSAAAQSHPTGGPTGGL